MRLTEEELHSVWHFGQEALGSPGSDVEPKWLISMVEEIRVSRAIPKRVGTRLIEDDIEFVEEEGISITRENARMQTTDVLINALDDLHLANLKLRVSLDAIVHMQNPSPSRHISECHRIAKEALR